MLPSAKTSILVLWPSVDAVCFPWFFGSMTGAEPWWIIMICHSLVSLNIPEHPWTLWPIEVGSLILVHRSRLGTWGEAHREALGGIAKLAVDQHCVRRRVVWLACSETSISTYDICASVYISTHTHMDAFRSRESVARLSCVRTINPSGFWTQSNNQHSRSTKWARPGVWSHDIPMVSDDSSAGVALSQL